MLRYLFNANVDPWARAVTRLVLHAEYQNTQVIGITGMRTGVGASAVARRLARAYSDLGRSVVLVDARTADPSGHKRPTREAEFADHSPATYDVKQQILDAVAKGMKVVVDLPPVDQAPGPSRSGDMIAATTCDLVYIVCLSGVTKKAELANCVEICRINNLKLGGIVANDRELPVSQLLASQ